MMALSGGSVSAADAAQHELGRRGGLRDLCRAIVSLRDEDEAEAFLRDIATPAEIKALTERWRIALLLDGGAHSYRDIAAETGASTTTVARVARFLKEEPHQGYRRMIDRLRNA